jgi:hypothetical protein
MQTLLLIDCNSDSRYFEIDCSLWVISPTIISMIISYCLVISMKIASSRSDLSLQTEHFLNVVLFLLLTESKSIMPFPYVWCFCIALCVNKPNQLENRAISIWSISMGKLVYNRRRCEWIDQNTSWLHFSSIDVEPRNIVHFSTVFIQKKALPIPASCTFSIRKTDEISRTLHLLHDGIGFDKILPKEGPKPRH